MPTTLTQQIRQAATHEQDQARAKYAEILRRADKPHRSDAEDLRRILATLGLAVADFDRDVQMLQTARNLAQRVNGYEVAEKECKVKEQAATDYEAETDRIIAARKEGSREVWRQADTARAAFASMRDAEAELLKLHSAASDLVELPAGTLRRIEASRDAAATEQERIYQQALAAGHFHCDRLDDEHLDEIARGLRAVYLISGENQRRVADRRDQLINDLLTGRRVLKRSDASDAFWRSVNEHRPGWVEANIK